MATMKAALHDGRGKMDVVEAHRPEAGPGEVVVRVRCSGICGTDLNRYAVNNTPEKLPSGH
jgi:L-iditol 2-dehydrogenase